VLHAYDATDLATELYNTSQASNGRDTPGGAVKFTVPTVANGKVYVGSQASLSIYGLLSPAATPAFSPVAGTYSSAQSVTISDTSAGVTIYYTNNGSTPTTSSTVYTGPIPVSTTTTIKAIGAGGGFSASAVATATYTINQTPAARSCNRSPRKESQNEQQTNFFVIGCSYVAVMRRLMRVSSGE
jgi:Chitobiase/beta-hexosaminidase C-terminal domain